MVVFSLYVQVSTRHKAMEAKSRPSEEEVDRNSNTRIACHVQHMGERSANCIYDLKTERILGFKKSPLLEKLEDS